MIFSWNTHYMNIMKGEMIIQLKHFWMNNYWNLKN